MAMKLVVDGTFVASLGSIQVLRFLVDECRTKCNLIHLYVLERDFEANKRVFIPDVQFTFSAVPHYLRLLITWTSLDPSTVVLSLNNLPPLCPVIKKRIVLIHNIFYLYTLKELFIKRAIVPKRFFPKYLYFRFIFIVCPPSLVLVQTRFMQQRLTSLLGHESSIVNTIAACDVSMTSAHPTDSPKDIRFDIAIVSGEAKHKNLDTVLRCLARDMHRLNQAVNGKCRIVVIGMNQPVPDVTDFVDENIEYTGIIEQWAVASIIQASRVCLVSSLAESLCLPVFDVALEGKPLVVQREEYSEELLSFAYFYDDADLDLGAALLDAFKGQASCALHRREVKSVSEIIWGE
jgi:hypothetical protein